MQNLEAFKQLISARKKIIITTHHKPDADALGSSLGLAGFLRKKGHEVTVVTPTDYPGFLHWMKGHREVVIYNEGNEKKSKQLVGQADLVFCLDFSSLDRINELGEVVRSATAEKVLIDHHLEPEDFARFTRWSTDAAATAELVHGLIVDLGEEHLIDKDIAECLYAGIMTDTGSFKHPNTTANVFAVCGRLIACGADIAKVSRLVYDDNTEDRIRFLGHALSERLTVIPEYRTAFFEISTEDLKRFNSKTGDTEGLVNYALSIKGVKLAALIIERPEGVKMSFRSVGGFSVNALAQAHFQGGGHKNAAGGRSALPLKDTVKKFTTLLETYKQELSNPNPKTLA